MKNDKKIDVSAEVNELMQKESISFLNNGAKNKGVNHLKCMFLLLFAELAFLAVMLISCGLEGC